MPDDLSTTNQNQPATVSSPNQATNTATPSIPVPTRTMASDARRADSIENERLAASQAALAEIQELEAALQSAGPDLKSDESSPDTKPTEILPTESTNLTESPSKEEVDKSTNNTAQVKGDITEDKGKGGEKAETEEPEGDGLITILDDSGGNNQVKDNKEKDPEPDENKNLTKLNSSDEVDNDVAQEIADPQDADTTKDDLAQNKNTQSPELRGDDDTFIKFIEEDTEELAEPEEDVRITALQKEIAKLEKSRLELQQSRSQFTKKEDPIRQKIESKKLQLKTTKDQLKPFIAQEEKIEDQILEMERLEKVATDPNDRHAVENKRWELEDRRHEIEKKKWEKSREVEEIAQTITGLQNDLKEIAREAESTDESLNHADKRIKELRLEIRLVELADKKEELENQWVTLNDRKLETESDLEETKASESVIEEQVDQLQKNATDTNDIAVRREYEQERHRVSLERRELEKKRWELEQKLRQTDHDIEELKPQYQKALDDESDMRQQLEDLKNSSPELEVVSSATK